MSWLEFQTAVDLIVEAWMFAVIIITAGIGLFVVLTLCFKRWMP